MLRLNLLGQFDVQSNNHATIAFKNQKVKELLCFLLLNREQSFTREFLADLLWKHSSTKQSKSYLRKCLWQLQSALELATKAEEPPLVIVEAEWVQINPAAEMWLDTAILTEAFFKSQGSSGRDLQDNQVEQLRQAVQLHRGELMTGCFADWCIFERERLQHFFLIMLDKLLDYAIFHGDFEYGLVYGTQILKFDIAHERTHRQLMSLYYLSGDRTRAIRQYETCKAILKKDLDVSPTEKTIKLFQEIKSDQAPLDYSLQKPNLPPEPNSSLLHEITSKLDHIQSVLVSIQTQLNQ